MFKISSIARSKADTCFQRELSPGWHLNRYSQWGVHSYIYIYIYISPELICDPAMFEILTDPTFKIHVALVVIDELHLAKNWKHFRKEYALL